MEIRISKTSGYSEEQPIDGSYIKEVEIVQVRSCSEEFFNKKYSTLEGIWLSKGFNHGVNSHGNIFRSLGYKKAWFIKIDTLYGLLSICKQSECELIVGLNDTEPYLEIYDDYRE